MYRSTVRTYLCNDATRIRLVKPFPQRRAVTLQPTPLLLNQPEVPQYPLPHAPPLPHVPRRVLAQQPNQVKVAHDTRAQRLQHLELQVVVVLVQALLAPAARRGGHGGGVRGLVVVDGRAVHVVHRADEVVDARGVGQRGDARGVLGADELGLEGDDEVDLAGVELLQALGLDEVGLVAGGEGGEGVGVVALGGFVSLINEEKRKGREKGRGYLLGVEVAVVVAGHVLGEGHGLVADGDGMLDDVLELVLRVAGAELARVGVHCEGHCGL